MAALLLRNSIWVVVAIGIAACAGTAQADLEDERPPEAYLDPVDRQIARTGKGHPGRPFPCAREVTDGQFDYIEFIPTDQCVKMLAPQRFRGLWRNEFEGSRLCPAPTRECSFHTAGERIWLTFAKDPARHKRDVFGGLYEVDFIGRQTKYEGRYGHMGVSDHEVIVDRLISMREIEPPPPPPTPTEQEASRTACGAGGNCISWDHVEKMRKGKQERAELVTSGFHP